MELIGSLTSPFVRKVRIVLAEKKLDYRLVLEDVWKPDTTIGNVNPLGKVPCLVMEDGGTLFDSRVIVEYVDTLSPVGRLIPTASRERAAVKCWEVLADGICDAAVLILKERQRPASQQNQDWIERQHGKMKTGMLSMNKSLGNNKWCYGNAITLADIAAVTAFDYLSFRYAEDDWATLVPQLANLAEQMAQRPSFASTAPTAATPAAAPATTPATPQ